MSELKKYIKEKKKALKEMHILSQLTDEEKVRLEHAKSEIAADAIARGFIEKYL